MGRGGGVYKSLYYAIMIGCDTLSGIWDDFEQTWGFGLKSKEGFSNVCIKNGYGGMCEVVL